MRVFQQAGDVRLGADRLGFAHDPGDQPDDGVGDDHSRDLAAGQDVVADGDLFINKSLPDSFIHTFVAPAEQDEMRLVREAGGGGVIEGGSLGT